MASREVSISPPPKRRRLSPPARPRVDIQEQVTSNADPRPHVKNDEPESSTRNAECIGSPFKLNFVPELPTSSNKDCISLGSVLGDPLIKECWLFNYLFDVDLIIQQFDPDVRSLIQVKLIHGSWRKEDRNRIEIEQACKRYSNVQSITTYMPEAFGTHHSKMMLLFRHDDTAQIVITTGNLIEQDWSMSQAFWCSPMLPPVSINTSQHPSASDLPGTGRRFKTDLLAYIAAYGTKLGVLHKQLQGYDFTAIRAALIASVPSKIVETPSKPSQTLWGLPSLSRILRTITADSSKRSHIVTQISSVASMGEKWLAETFFPALSAAKAAQTTSKPGHSIVFPNPDEIRKSILGYVSGGSIHMKLGTTAQQKQLDFLKPMLRHWGPGPSSSSNNALLSTVDKGAAGQDSRKSEARRAGRHPAAPHIKTYIRFADEQMGNIEWAMVTSANMSTQAWGTRNPQGEWRICSYEIGVIVWPGLWDERVDDGSGQGSRTLMVPTFGRDMPPATQSSDSNDSSDGDDRGGPRRVVGLRMPYDLPLRSYVAAELPWCNNQPHMEKDWMGRSWRGHQ